MLWSTDRASAALNPKAVTLSTPQWAKGLLTHQARAEQNKHFEERRFFAWFVRDVALMGLRMTGVWVSNGAG